MMSWIGERTEYSCAMEAGRPACVVSAVTAMLVLGRMRLIVDVRFPDYCEE
jgi:hypothetical protein